MAPSSPKKRKANTLLPPSARDRCSIGTLEMPPPVSTTSHKIKMPKMPVVVYLGDWSVEPGLWPLAFSMDITSETKIGDILMGTRNSGSIPGNFVPAGHFFVGHYGRETLENMIDRRHLRQEWIEKTISSFEEYENGLLIAHVMGKMDGSTNSTILPRSQCASDL